MATGCVVDCPGPTRSLPPRWGTAAPRIRGGRPALCHSVAGVGPSAGHSGLTFAAQGSPPETNGFARFSGGVGGHELGSCQDDVGVGDTGVVQGMGSYQGAVGVGDTRVAHEMGSCQSAVGVGDTGVAPGLTQHQ